MTAAEVTQKVMFDDLEIAIIESSGEEWFCAEDIGKALGLVDPRVAVMKILTRNREEFEGLYHVTSLVTWLKSGGKLPYKLTVFNPAGAHLVALHSHSPKSKALRRWLAKFMAHDLERLRAHVAALRSGKAGLTARLHEAQKKLAARPYKKVKSLPAPEPLQTAAPALPPYECRDDDLIWCRYQDLRRLVALTCEAGHQDFAPPWLGRVAEANSSLDRRLDLVRTGFRALQGLLYFPPAGGVPCLSKEEQRLPKSSIRTAD